MTKMTPPVLGTLESALYAGDLDAAMVFWRDVMGLQPFQAVPGRHVFFRVGQSQVLLVFDPAATISAWLSRLTDWMPGATT